MDTNKLQELYEDLGRNMGHAYPSQNRDEMNYAIDYAEARFHGETHDEAIAAAEAMAEKFNKPQKPQPKVEPYRCHLVGGPESR